MNPLRRWLSGGTSVRLQGADLPDGPFILAVHHSRRMDVVAVSAALRAHTSTRLWLGLVTRAHPYPWSTRVRAKAFSMLQAGRAVVAFPEVATAPGKAVYKADIGVADLALHAKVPVVPGYLDPGGSCLVVGEALDFRRHWDTRGSRPIVRAMADEIMIAIAELSGLPYRDLPASSVRAQRAADRADRAAARERERRLRAEREREETLAEERELAAATMDARRAARLHALEAAMADRAAQGAGREIHDEDE